MTRCLAPDCRMGGVGCDNMTVIVVCLLQGGDYDKLCAKCGRRSAAGNRSSAGSNSKLNRTVENSEEDGDEWYDCCEDEPLPSSCGHEETVNATTEETVTQKSDTVAELVLADQGSDDENTHIPADNSGTDCNGVQPSCDNDDDMDGSNSADNQSSRSTTV